MNFMFNAATFIRNSNLVLLLYSGSEIEIFWNVEGAFKTVKNIYLGVTWIEDGGDDICKY